jgi:hypothetical protein
MLYLQEERSPEAQLSSVFRRGKSSLALAKQPPILLNFSRKIFPLKKRMEKSAFCLLSLLMISAKTALAAVAIGLAIVSPGKNFVEPKGVSHEIFDFRFFS